MKKIYAGILALIMTLQLVALTVVYGESDVLYVENSGFEDELNGWNADNAKLYSLSTDEKRTGEASLKIQIPAENKSAWHKISQNIKVTAGKTYALTFYSKLVSGTGTHHIDGVNYTHKVPEDEWTKHTTVFTAKSNTITIGFGNYYGETTEFFVDDIELVEANVERKDESIVNGDFENDIDNLGWNFTDDCFNISDSEKFTGNKSLRVKVNTAQNKSYYLTYNQNVNVIAGKEYQLKFYCKNVAGKTMVKVEYGKDSAGKAKVLQTNITAVGDWKQYTVDFIAEIETINIFIQNYAGTYDNELYLDDFTLTRREPTIKSSDIFGYAAAGNTVTLTADAVDLCGDTIENIKYQWQIKNSDAWSDINGEVSEQYTISKDDVGAYLRAAIIPVSVGTDDKTRTGETVYTKEILVSADSNNQIVDISGDFNGKFIGSKNDFENTSEKFMFISDNVERNANNAFTFENIPYDVVLNGDKRGIRSENGELKITLNDSYYKRINCLMTYLSAPQDEQTAILEFTDGSTKEIMYDAGVIDDNASSRENCINLGIYEKEENSITENTGYVYAYSFDVGEIKQIKSISFPQSEDDLIVFAVTAENPEAADLKNIINDKIAELPDKITSQDKDRITEIQKYVQLYKMLGGNINDLDNYELISDITVDIKDVKTNNGLYDYTIDILFTNHISSDSVNKENVFIENVESERYYVTALSDEEGINGIRVTMINYFDYPEIKVAVSENIKCDKEPHFDLGENRKFIYKIMPLIKITDEKMSVNSGKVEFSVSLCNESDTDLPYYIVAAVYSEENEQLLTTEISGELAPGETKIESKTVDGATLPQNVNTKIMVFDSKDAMHIIKGNIEKCTEVNNNKVIFDSISKKIIVCGNTKEAKEGVPLSVMILKPDESVQYADTVRTGPNGSYSFDVKLHQDENNDFGTYKVFIGGYNYANPELAGNIYIASETEIKDTIEKLNDAKSSEISEYSRILNINFELFDSADKDELTTLIRNEARTEKFNADDQEGTLKRLKKIAIVERYNSGKKADLLDDKILYADEMELDNFDVDGITIRKVFDESTSDEGKSKTIDSMLGRNFKSVNEFESEFLKQMMLKGIAYPNDGGIGYIAKILTKENAKACHMNADIYFNRKDKTAVNSKIAKKLYATIAELEDAINVKETVASGGNSGSSGSGKGSNVYIPEDTKTDDSKTSTQQVMFADVPQTHWAYKAIYRLRELEIISGVSDNTFAPEQAITREQFVKLLCEAMNIEGTAMASFSDVDENSWYAKYVYGAYENGIISGVADGIFGTGRKLKRQELCTMIVRAAKVQADESAELQFDDSGDIAEYAKGSVAYLVHNGAVNGFSDNTFRPNDYCTRAQAAKILYEVLDTIK